MIRGSRVMEIALFSAEKRGGNECAGAEVRSPWGKEIQLRLCTFSPWLLFVALCVAF